MGHKTETLLHSFVNTLRFNQGWDLAHSVMSTVAKVTWMGKTMRLRNQEGHTAEKMIGNLIFIKVTALGLLLPHKVTMVYSTPSYFRNLNVLSSEININLLL